tara:strand:- start:1962 stop:4640 length:2679 start_codon:yes stop_codon:yes gene_type:complete
MSTLRVDKIKSRTGTTVTIPDSQNLSVTGGLTVSGTQSFPSGATLSLQGTDINAGTRGQVLYYDTAGKIAKLDIGSAGAVLKSDGTDVSWGAIGGTPAVYYVATNGVDAAGRGGSVDTAYKTVKYACGNIVTPTATSPAIIFIKGGVYEESQLPIIVPPYTTITGDSLRTTILKPAAGLDSGGSVLNNKSTLFRLSNGVIIQDLVCDGMTGYTVGNPGYDPTVATLGGVYFALNSASTITEKSPYIYNVTTFGDGATGAYIDGSLHASGNRTMLFHTYTAIHSDGLGIWAKDNSAAEIISGFTYYNQVGYVSTGGSQIRSLNSSNSYGEYGVFSKGYDSSESANQGAVVGTMLKYVGVISTAFTNGEQITGSTSGATANIINVQSEPKVMYIVNQSGTFQAGETVSGASASIVLDSGSSFAHDQSGRILVTTFATPPDTGDSVQFATTDGNAYQIQSLSTVSVGATEYKVLVFSTSRATPVPNATVVNCRKRFSTVRLTGHDFLKVGTGDKTTTNWPGTPTQVPSPADQIVTNTTDPGRVYYVATDELGNFYVGDYFKVDQATGNVTLDASAFDLKGLESLQLGAIGGLIGASVNEFSTDGDMVQNSDVKVPTQAAVRTYVDKLSAINPGGNNGTLTISGNLTVSGTTTTVNTTNTTIADKLIELGNGTTGAPSGDTGIILERGDQNNAFIGFDESDDKFVLKTTTATGASTGDLAFVTTGTLVANLEGTVTGNASSANVAGAVTVSNQASDTTCFPLFATGATGNLAARSNANLTFDASTGTLSATKLAGRLANVPASNKTSAYNAVGTDAGTIIRTNSNVQIQPDEFAAGDIISIYNNSGSDISITAGTGVTLRLVGDAGTGTRTLAQRGLMTVTCVSSNEFVCSGGGMT